MMNFKKAEKIFISENLRFKGVAKIENNYICFTTDALELARVLLVENLWLYKDIKDPTYYLVNNDKVER